MHIHKNAQTVAAVSEQNLKRAEEMANRLDLMLRSALVEAVQNLPKLPEPRHYISDTHRAHRRPAHQFGELIGLLKIGGLPQYEARVFVSKVMLGFVDAIYSDERLPGLDELVPKLIEEVAESESADVRAIATKSPADYMRALDEGAEAIALAEIVQRRRQAECATRRFTVSR